MENNKKLTMNTIAASIIKNSLYFLVIFGIIFACFLPFVTITGTMDWTTASIYSMSIAALSILIRTNSYMKYFLEYQRYKSYVVNALLYSKYKENIYLDDVQTWIEKENKKLESRFLRDASYYLGVELESDGTLDLNKFYPQEPTPPERLSKRATPEKKSQYELDMENYEKELYKYKRRMEKFKITWIQKRYIKRLKDKNYPVIPWSASAILNVIGDADFYVNRNVFKQEKRHKRITMASWIIFTAFMLFTVGTMAFGAAEVGWTTVVQAGTALFSIIASLIFGGVQGTKGGKYEERSLVTANGIFAQINPQQINNEEIEKYIKQNQIVVVYEEDGSKVKVDMEELADMVTKKLEIEEEK